MRRPGRVIPDGNKRFAPSAMCVTTAVTIWDSGSLLWAMETDSAQALGKDDGRSKKVGSLICFRKTRLGAWQATLSVPGPHPRHWRRPLSNCLPVLHETFIEISPGSVWGRLKKCTSLSIMPIHSHAMSSANRDSGKIGER
jgi:hypothetical protein